MFGRVLNISLIYFVKMFISNETSSLTDEILIVKYITDSVATAGKMFR